MSVGGRKGPVEMGAAGGELKENFKGDYPGRKGLCTVGRDHSHPAFKEFCYQHCDNHPSQTSYSPMDLLSDPRLSQL